MSQPYIEDRQGRKRGSDATAHYVARFDGEAEDHYARMHGLEVEEDEAEPIGSVECPRCGKETPRHEPVCVWCKQALDHAGAEALEEEERMVRQVFLRFAKEHSELLDDVQGTRDFSDLMEDYPDFLARLRISTRNLVPSEVLRISAREGVFGAEVKGSARYVTQWADVYTTLRKHICS